MNDLLFILEMALLGAGVGVFSAALGLGGGVLMVPAFLAFVPEMDTHTAKGTSLLLIVFVSGLNAWQITREWPSRPWRLVGVFAIGSIVGSYVGAWVTTLVSEEVILVSFIALLAFVGLRTFLLKEQEVNDADVGRHTVAAIFIGMLAGVAGGATGTGGGAVLIPLALMMGIETNKRVVGLSNLVMVATSIAGTIPHLRAEEIYPYPQTIGHIYLPLIPVVFLGAMIGSPLGKKLNSQMTLRTRRVVMAVVIVLIGGQMLYRLVRL